MDRALWGMTVALAFIAILVLVPTAWNYVEKWESGQTCLGVQEMGELCIVSVFDGRTYTVVFDTESFGAQDTSTLLVGILTASAAILAISFTVNQVVLSSISQKYSSRLVESYAKRHPVSFVAFVLTVAGSAVLLLARDSLYAWTTAFAWALTAFFLVALLFFAREFMHMMRVVSPYNFIEDAREKILASMKEAKRKGAPTRSSGEPHSLIRSLGDATVKSRASNDADVCVACIDALYKVGRALLDRRGDNQGECGVGDEPSGELWRSDHAIYVAEEFVRILNDSMDIENSPITLHVLEKLEMITAFAMQDKSNEKVIKALYDTDRIKGSPYLQLAERLTYMRGKSSRNYIIRHLAYLPHTTVENGGHMPFVEQFVTFHILRAVMVIIDKDDFEMFKEVIRLFSNYRFFNHMEDTRGLIRSEIRHHASGMQDLAVRRDKIVFELYHDAKKDFGRILELKEEIESLLSRACPSDEAHQKKARKVSRYMDSLYVSSLLCGTFFRIACYIIHKGGRYAAYLYELWYHDDSDGQRPPAVRSPPCSKDMDWNSAYPVWRGLSDLAQISPLNMANRYEPHYYEYAVLHMLREDKIWSVPTEDDVAGWGSRGQDHALRYHYVSMSRMDADRFMKALDSLAKTELPAEMLPGQNAQARIESVRKKLEEFRDGTQHVFDMLVELVPLDGGKIGEWEDNARHAYSENTQADEMARIRYDAQLQGGAIVGERQIIPRKMLFGVDGEVPDRCIGFATAWMEFKKILEIAGDRATQVRTDPHKPRESIKACVKKMRDGGHNPRVAFVSSVHGKEMPETRTTHVINAGGPPIAIMDMPGYSPPPDTWILDPDCVEITYKAKNGHDRMQLDVQDTKAERITAVSRIQLSVKVLDGGGIVKIASGEA